MCVLTEIYAFRPVLMFIIFTCCATHSTDFCDNGVDLEESDEYESPEQKFKELITLRKYRMDAHKVTKELKDIPDKLIYSIKFDISDVLHHANITSAVILSQAVRLYDVLSNFYQLESSQLVDDLVKMQLNGEFTRLMIAIISSTPDAGRIQHSFDELVRCSKLNLAVKYTLQLLNYQRNKWIRQVIVGLNEYINLKKMLQMTSTYLNLQPTSSCDHAYAKLVRGCYRNGYHQAMNDPYMTARIEPLHAPICANYCSNIVRGCFSVPLLLLPGQLGSRDDADVHPWDIMLSNPLDQKSAQIDRARSRIEHTFHLMLTSLNTTGFVEIIKEAVIKAETDIQRINAELRIHCERYQEKSEIDRPIQIPVPSLSAPPLKENDRSALADVIGQVYLVQQQLTELAQGLKHSNSFVMETEKAYCHNADSFGTREQMQSSNCWNGFDFTGYNASVPPFTRDGQKTNPEFEFSRKMNINATSDTILASKVASDDNIGSLSLDTSEFFGQYGNIFKFPMRDFKGGQLRYPNDLRLSRICPLDDEECEDLPPSNHDPQTTDINLDGVRTDEMDSTTNPITTATTMPTETPIDHGITFPDLILPTLPDLNALEDSNSNNTFGTNNSSYSNNLTVHAQRRSQQSSGQFRLHSPSGYSFFFFITLILPGFL